jgi:hypothetical protein
MSTYPLRSLAQLGKRRAQAGKVVRMEVALSLSALVGPLWCIVQRCSGIDGLAPFSLSEAEA